jgi:hypothetical protein
MMGEEQWLRIMELASPYLTARWGWNLRHVEISLQFARMLMAAEGGRPEVVIPAVILHDVGWSCVPGDLQAEAFGPRARNPRLNRLHEVEGVRLAREILIGSGYPEQWRAEILAIVDNHDSGPAARSLNDALVKDADKLWRFSLDGFTRSTPRFQLEPEANWQRLHDSVDKWMLTVTGKRLAREQLVLLQEADYGRGGDLTGQKEP